ncbi:MAG TPA: DUF6176 family protein [candidate division Zixibacteria bacterium]|nr:DUF6176 family protein [candidate division Zixibacteria bacterium]
MKTYLFTVPIVPGKTETWKNYSKELTGNRHDEYRKSRQRLGITKEQVFLQKTPKGDMCVVMLQGDNPQKALEMMKTSTDPFDKWFRERILIESHGLDVSQPIPQNERVLDFDERPAMEYAGSHKH